MPSISVIIPAYNYGRYIRTAIDSVLVQTLPASEIIVVDDGSTDDTEGEVRSYGSRVVYVKQSNSGVSVARNHGVGIAKGEYIAFLDPDDYWYPWKLEVQHQYLEGHPDVGVVTGNVLGFTSEDNIPRISGVTGNIPDVIEYTFQELYLKNRVTTSAVMMSSQIFRKVGGFDSRWHGPEDFDLWLKISRDSKIVRLPVNLVAYRFHESSLSHKIEEMERQVVALLENHRSRLSAHEDFRLYRMAVAQAAYQSAWTYIQTQQWHKALNSIARSIKRHPGCLAQATGRKFCRLKMFMLLIRGFLHSVCQSQKPRVRGNQEV